MTKTVPPALEALEAELRIAEHQETIAISAANHARMRFRQAGGSRSSVPASPLSTSAFATARTGSQRLGSQLVALRNAGASVARAAEQIKALSVTRRVR